MFRIPRLVVRSVLSLTRSPAGTQTFIQKNLAQRFESLSSAVQSSEQVKRWSSSDLKISELISKNVEAEQFILERFKLLSSNLRLDHLTARIQHQIQTKDPKKIISADLKLLAHIAENDSEIDLLIKGIKLFVKDDDNQRLYRFGPLLMKLLVVLDKTERAIELFQDKELELAFKGPASANVLMKKYLYLKNYPKVLEVFDLQKERYVLENLNLKPDMKIDVNLKAQAIPTEHMKSVSLSLLHLNNPESCEKARELIKFSIQKTSFICNLGLARLFTLAIKQNDLELAELVVSRFKPADQKETLFLNLTAVIKAKQNEMDEAFKIIDRILLIPRDEKLKLNGCLFSDVIKAVVECIKSQQAQSSDKNKMDSYRAKLKAVMDVLKSEKRLFRQEIYKYCTEKM